MFTRLFKKEPENSGQPVVLLVGLGNPGRDYRLTRHNVGFMVIDRISQSLGVSMSRLQSKALIASAPLGEVRLVLAKPQTFMNLSGQSVSGLLRFYKVPLERLLIIHDDLDLPVGTLRLRPGGGSAGQKGLASTIQQLGTQEFPRMRIGIGRPPGQMDAADYVLHGFDRGDEDIVNLMLDKAVDAARTFALEGLEKAMNTFNGSLLKE
jgi:PTH1 family peptidyl-tRNA hydrolase